MATRQNPTTLKGIVLGSDPPASGQPPPAIRGIVTGPGTFAKEGEKIELGTWVMRHLEGARRVKIIEGK